MVGEEIGKVIRSLGRVVGGMLIDVCFILSVLLKVFKWYSDMIFDFIR